MLLSENMPRSPSWAAVEAMVRVPGWGYWTCHFASHLVPTSESAWTDGHPRMGTCVRAGGVWDHVWRADMCADVGLSVDRAHGGSVCVCMHASVCAREDQPRIVCPCVGPCRVWARTGLLWPGPIAVRADPRGLAHVCVWGDQTHCGFCAQISAEGPGKQEQCWREAPTGVPKSRLEGDLRLSSGLGCKHTFPGHPHPTWAHVLTPTHHPLAGTLPTPRHKLADRHVQLGHGSKWNKVSRQSGMARNPSWGAPRGHPTRRLVGPHSTPQPGTQHRAPTASTCSHPP